MADYIATAELEFNAANSIAGLLVNPLGSNKTVTVRKLAAVPTQGHVPNAVVRRLTGVTHTPIQDTTPPEAMRVASSSAAAHAIPTTSSDHTYSGGAGNFDLTLALHSQLGTEIVLSQGEALAVVMSEDGSGARARFAVHWSE